MNSVNYKITDTSTYALKLMESCSQAFIHSVYNKTVNICIENELLALQCTNSPISSISLITELSESALSSLQLEPCIPVKLSFGSLQLGDYHFSLCDAQVHDLSLHCGADTLTLHHIYDLLNDMIHVSADHGGFELIFNHSPKVNESLMLLAAKKLMASCCSLIKRNDAKTAAQSLSGLIGLGIGLTPSGDDFLCGLLAGCQLIGTKNALDFVTVLRDLVRANIKNTNDISAAFLRCALGNQYSSAICMLVSSASDTAVYEAFCSIDHSSGIDTLCGIKFAFDCFYLVSYYSRPVSR